MFEKFFVFILICASVCMSALFSIGPMFPLRFVIIAFILIIFYKAFVFKKTVVVIQNSYYKTGKLYNLTSITFCVMMVIGFITLYWAYSKEHVVDDLITTASSFLCIYMVLFFVKTKEDVVFASRVLVFNYIAYGIHGIYESFTGDYFNLTYQFMAVSKNVFGLFFPASIFYNINNFAIFMVLVMPICFIATSGLKRKGLWDFLLIAFGEAIIVLTGCNTALVLSCVVIAMYLFFNRNNKIFWIILLIIIMILILFSSVIESAFSQIITYSLEEENRLNIWQRAFEVSREYYFMGVGPGNSTIVNGLRPGKGMAVHNYLLTIFEEYGIITFSFFVYWIYKLFATAVYYYRRTKDEFLKYVMIFVAIFLPSTLCASGMTGYYYIWIIFGLIMALTGCCEKEYINEQPKGENYGTENRN